MPANTVEYIHENGQVKPVHPIEFLKELATKWNMDVHSEEFSKELDQRKLWPNYREKFYYPKVKDLPNSKIRV
jgi:hypothetical protein